MAHSRRDRTRAARRRVEKTKLNLAARERGELAVEAAEDAKSRPRNARHAAQLDILLHRCIVTLDQARAGHRFGRDFRASNSVIGRLVGRYEANQPGKPKRYAAPAPDTPSVIVARERFERAIAALGPLSPIVIHVAITDLPASAWGANGKPNGDAVGILRLALSVLCVHYGRASSPKGAAEAPAHRPNNPVHVVAALA